MNTPPQSESGPSCSGSVASLKDSFAGMDMDRMATNGQIGGYQPPTPPMEGHHGQDDVVVGKFFLGPVDDMLRDCETVVEEDEESGETGTSDFQSTLSSSNEGSFTEKQTETPPPAASPTILASFPKQIVPQLSALKRRSTSRLSSLLKRSQGSSEMLPEAAIPVNAPLKPRRSFNLFRGKSIEMNGLSPRIKPTRTPPSPQDLSDSDQSALKSAVERPTSPYSQRPRHARSASMTGIAKLSAIQSNQISHPAPDGVGLKARKMSRTPSTIFPEIESIPLSAKYTNHSSVPLKKKTVGTGATATVSLVRRIDSSSPVYAVKEFRKKSSAEQEDEYKHKIESEYYVSKSLRHPNIVETMDLCTKSGRWCHVMEYCPGGDLFSLIQKGFMKDAEKLCCFKQLLRGVTYLHENGIAHRDIKPENLLMSADGHLKITDFGVAEIFSGKHPGAADGVAGVGVDPENIRMCRPGICGSIPYLSPEVMAKKEEYDPRKLDVWSCAIVYITLHFTGNPWVQATPDDPRFTAFSSSWDRWLTKNPSGLIRMDDNDMPACRIYSEMRIGLKRLLLRMTHPDPAKRIDIETALNDRFVDGIECCTMDDMYACNKSVDASAAGACDVAGKMNVRRMHTHLPPKHF